MTNPDPTVVAAYSIPADFKERIEKMAKDQDLNASQLVRRILRDYFERIDAERKLARKAPQSIAA